MYSYSYSLRQLIWNYLEAEHRKHPECSAFDRAAWKLVRPRDLAPQQTNENDCGVFVCQFVRALMRGESIDSVRACDMPYYRGRMVLDLFDY